MTSLFIRLDPMLALRQAGSLDPEPAAAASLAELAGADGVSVVCGREAGRMQERDIRLLREMVRGVLNLGLPPSEEFVKLALALRPDMATFVPEPGDGVPARGLDVEDRRAELAPMVAALHGAGIGTAVLLDSSPVQVKAAQRVGVGTVLLHTGRLVWAAGTVSRAAEYESLVNAAKVAHRLGLTVHAGGGLSYQNLRPVAQLLEIEAVHVGHALVARALLTGIPEAVRELLRVLAGGRDQ
jgi:pyridoxine 5-phosphate synthase